MHTFKSSVIELAKIFIGKNVRLPALMKLPELAADILENGLLTPPQVFGVKNGFEVIQGHRRAGALKWLAENEPKDFARLFPKGIPVSIIEGITYEEAQVMKVDHGNEVSLSDPMELQLCANILFAQSKTEKQVVIRLASLMDVLSPMKANKRKQYDTMLSDVKLLELKGEAKAAREKAVEAETFLLNYRKGKVQNLKLAFNCPDIVMAALWFKATGERPPKGSDFEIDPKAKLPTAITYGDIGKLAKAFAEDMEAKKDGVFIYNKRNPGPVFLSKWAEVCKSLEEKEAAAESGVTRAKAMSANDMEDELKSSKWLSALGQLITRHHKKEEVDHERIKQLDKIAYFAELISERDPDTWADTVKLAEALEKEQVEATKQVKVAKKK